MNGAIVFHALLIVGIVSSLPELPPDPPGQGWTSKRQLRWETSESDRDALYRTVWGEARGLPPQEQAAIVHVILNRWQSGRWGNLEATVKAPWQFSVWNKDDPNYVHMHDPLLPKRESFQAIRALCDLLLAIREESDLDPTKGANHYHHLPNDPYWAAGRQATILGKTKLYRL
jgi:N-acetylmuramoyl-L-alanine amidase